MSGLLIIADTPYWYTVAIQTLQVYRGRHPLRVGVSSKFWSRATLDTRYRFNDITREHTAREATNVFACNDSLLGQFDRVLSLHCTEIFTKNLAESLPCYNLHPGLLPNGRGWKPVTWARYAGTPAGATLHLMDEGIDTGPVIDAIEVPYAFEDHCGEIWKKVQAAERQLYRRWIERLIVQGLGDAVLVHQHRNPPTRTKEDFQKLTKLRMSEKMTVSELLNRLAALTINNHESHAYIEDARGHKIKVGVFMERVDDA